MNDVEAIERATVAAVAPEAAAEIDGWLVAMGTGTIRRRGSAVPLRHDLEPGPATIEDIEAAFEARGLAPAFRVADEAGLQGVRAELARRGYASEQPTLVKTASVSAVIGVSSRPPAEVLDRPDAAWAAVFLGEGFDPVDGANRVEALSRSPGAAYAQVREDGRTIAVGVGSFGNGWVSFHGMRTEKSRRGEGLAGRVLAALALAARERGIERAFLQVEEANAPARALYRRAGFTPAWRYLYWSQAR